MALYSTVLDLIGDTPLVDISTLSPNPAARIYMKLEGHAMRATLFGFYSADNPAGFQSDTRFLAARVGFML